MEAGGCCAAPVIGHTGACYRACRGTSNGRECAAMNPPKVRATGAMTVTSVARARVTRPRSAKTARVTVLFADLRGYTGLAERLAPARIVPLLDEFFGVLAGATALHGGQVFHMAGDGMMAGFGLDDGGAETAHAMRWRPAMRCSRTSRRSRSAGGANSRSRAASGWDCISARWRWDCSGRRAIGAPRWSATPSTSPRGFAVARGPARF